METHIENEENNLNKEKKEKFLHKIPLRLTKKNYGWWILSIFLIILVVGIVRTWFNPDAYIVDPFLEIIDVFLYPFGTSLEGLDKRNTNIFQKLGMGTELTFYISVISVVVGFFLALLLAIILVNVNPKNIEITKFYGKEIKSVKLAHFLTRFMQTIQSIIKFLAQAYVDFFRSTPLLVQILLVYFGLPRFFVLLARTYIPFMSIEIFAGTLALSLNTAAYQAEIIRGGILAIPIGQTEAARALGLTSQQTMRHVILPQTIRIIIPPLTNELINVLLNSSLVSAIGVLELTKRARALQSAYFMWEVFFYAAIFYFVIAFSLSKLTKRLEIKMRIPGLGVQIND